ncbi:MAG: endonuclease III, partial [Oscillospiraceae bacterium]
MTKKNLALAVVGALKKLYPQAICSLEYNQKKPYELLIATRLSAQCTDARVNIVTKGLFEKYTSIEAFANAQLSEVQELIKSCGLYKTKAKSIIEMANQIMTDFNGKLPESLEDLTSLSGIGRKTANLIMGDIYHKPAVITDTHCIRICYRIGLTTTNNPLKTENELLKILPPEESSDFCHRIVHFGRDVCTARSPACDRCVLAELCLKKKY